MVKVLNREGIQRMVGRGSGSGGSGGSSEGGGGISLAQVDAAYVSKAFFDQLFTVHGKRTYIDPETEEEVTEDVIISPNQIAEGEYSLSNVEVSVGLWTQQFLSALGLNSGGGGGGGATALSELVDVALSNPQNGQALVYNSATGKWVNGTVTPDLSDYATKAWVQQQNYITSSAISDMATKTWVGQQGFITSSAISDMATKTWVGQQGYATQQWVQQQNYITSSTISDMATKTWVGQQGFLKASDLNGYATQQWVGQNYLGVNDTAAAATKLQTARKIWGQSFDGTGNITGDMEDVGVIFQNGRYTVMGRNEAHGAMIESLTNTVTIGLHNGNGVGWDTRSGSGFMLQTVYDASNTVAKKYTRVYDGLRIGDGMLVWDGYNNALKVINANGTAANLYATGGVSALGMSAGVSQVDAMTFNNLSVKNSMTLNGSVNIITGSQSQIIRSSGNSDCIYLLNYYEYSKVNHELYYYNQYDNVGLHGTNYNYDETWYIDPDGCAKFNRLYLDSTRYLYINGGTLYYYNGSTSRQIAFA